MRHEQAARTNGVEHWSMQFPGPTENPWTEEFFARHLRRIGVRDPKVTDADVARVKNCYDPQPPARFYHTPDHGAFVGTPHIPPQLAAMLTMPREIAEAHLVLGGLPHDQGYTQVDAFVDRPDEGLLRTPLREQLRGVADARRIVGEQIVYQVQITPTGEQDPVTQVVGDIFGVTDGQLTHKKGANEFVSALGAAQMLERHGAPPHARLVNAALIEGTVPFRPSVERNHEGAIIGDGAMSELAQRVKGTTLSLGGETYTPGWTDVNDIMLLAVHLANRDVASFIGDIPTFIKNGRDVKKEEIPILRKGVTTMEGLVVAARREASSPLLYGWIRDSLGKAVPVPADNVPSIYFPRNREGKIEPGTESYPPRAVYEAAVERVRVNCDYASLFFEAHELGIATAASIATLVDEPNPSVPGFVFSVKWDDRSLPQGGKLDNLTPNERIVYEELLYGTHQIDVDTATPRRSPIAGVLLGVLGKEGIRTLSRAAAQLQEAHKAKQVGENPFANPALAQAYLDKIQRLIGDENLRTILTELHRVAVYFQDHPKKGNKDRAIKLKQLAPQGRIREYSA